MFRKALIKMTLLYLLIIMVISLFFSVILYQISSQEIKGSFKRQQNVYEEVGPFMHDFLADPTVLKQRDQQILAANQRIVWQLIYTNLVILAVGGGLSYYLAQLTIKPIEDAHEAQVRFTGDASHELRSPLASMRTEIEVALREKKISRDEAVAVLESNLEEVNRLSHLAEYLLELAKEDGGKLELKKAYLHRIAQGAIVAVADRAKDAKINIENKVADQVYAVVNPESFKELLIILLDNAIKYSEPGKKIVVESARVSMKTEIRVIDQGYGIKNEDIPYIFDRFYRVDSSRTKNKVEGYGLGLSLAKKIANANHAEICAKSKVGVGTTFIIKI
jgi:two-component system, OmpR family, sensor histidine kinase CiaH